MMKYTVLSYIVGGYEKIVAIKEKSPNARYIMVTDNPGLVDESQTWEVIYDKDLIGSTFDKCYQIRFNPFRYTDDDIVIRIDGCICVEKNLDPIIEKFLASGADMCLMQHPIRRTIYDELMVWAEMPTYSKDQANKVINFMKNYGLDVKNTKGLAQLGFVVQKNDHLTANINNMTYSFLRLMGDEKTGIERVDQTMFSFVCQRYYPNMNILWVNETMFHGRFLTLYQHKTHIMRGMISPNSYPPAYFNNVKIDKVLSQDDF